MAAFLRTALVFAAAWPCVGQAVSNIHFDGIGDSSARVLFNVSGPFNAFRIRYGTADTASGKDGWIQTNGTSPNTYVQFDMAGNISGLAPGTPYYVSPEVSNDRGTTWSRGVSARLTTLPRTQTLPIPPTPVSTNFPAQTGAIRNVAADCSNLQAAIDAAVGGDTIVVPAGTICPGSYVLPAAPEAQRFSPANVQTGNSTITIPHHRFTENQEVRVSAGPANQNCLPGMSMWINCDVGGGWQKGARYWLHVADANTVQLLDSPGGSPVIPGWIQFTCEVSAGTITYTPTWQASAGFAYLRSPAIPANTVVQFHSTGTLCGGLALNTNYYLLSPCPAFAKTGCKTQVSLSARGTPVAITSAGTGIQRIVDRGLGAMYIEPAPRPNGPWIVITSGGTVPPPGVRTTPGFDAHGFHLRRSVPLYSGTPVFSGGILSHNWRIVGAIFDTGKNDDYLTTVDPRGYCSILTTNQDNENIIFDRTRVQGPGYPNRFGCSTAIFFNGRNVGVINSDWRGMDYWHPWYTGFRGSFTSSTVKLSAGSAYAGPSIFNTQTTGNTVITVTSGGGVSGTVYVYFAMDGTLKVLPPVGVRLICRSAGPGCTVLNGVSAPAWPLDKNGRIGVFQLATFALTAGSVTAVCANGCTDPFPSVNASEGAQSIIAGSGPGPYLFDNNFISGSGIPLHFDDGGGPFIMRGDYTITHNTFDVPASEMATGPASNGPRYGHRNSLEWKGGQRILVAGNIFQGSFSEDSPACLTVAVTPRAGGTVSDFDFTDNTVTGCGGLNIPAPVDTFQPVSKPAQRTRVQNNLFLLNGPAYVVRGAGAPRGWTMEAGWGSEDVLIDHNTAYDARGSTPAFLYWTQNPAGGVTITDNIFFYTGDLPAIRGEGVSPGCGNMADKPLMDCAFTNGPGNPAYTFAGNVIVPSWVDSTMHKRTLDPSVVENAYPSSLRNYIPENLNTIKFSSANLTGNPEGLDLRLDAQSPYANTGAGGTQAGANIDRLQQAQGLILQLRTLSVSSTTATISALAPLAGAPCYVGYGTSNTPATWTWTTADTASSRQRNIAIQGLVSKQQYFYSMACAQAPMPSIEMFRSE